jgi:cold shock CspA family protein
MQGTVTTINPKKLFGFAAPDDGSENVFLPPKLSGWLIQNGQLTAGSRVEFTVGKPKKPGQKRPATSLRIIPHANNTTLSNRPAATADPANAPTNPSAPQVIYPEGAVRVSWNFQLANERTLIVAVAIGYCGLDASLFYYDCKEGWEPVATRTSDEQGIVKFIVELQPDEETKQFLLEIGGFPDPKNPGQTKKRAWETLWQRVQTKTNPSLAVELLYKDRDVYGFNLITCPQGPVTVKSACLINVRKSGEQDWSAAGRTHCFDAGKGGTLELEIRIIKTGDRGVVSFEANGLTHQEYLTNDQRSMKS